MKFLRIINIPKCIIVSNFNDYITKKLVVLCAESILSNEINQTYRIVIINYNSGKIDCFLNIDYTLNLLKVYIYIYNNFYFI